jgi:hypothetical protein
MAVGDTKADTQTIANGASLEIRPASGEEWLVDNCYGEAAFALDRLTASLTITAFRTVSSAPWVATGPFRVTNTHYMRIRNTSGASQELAYDGVQTK